jgi:methionine-gamma-lyase
MPRVIKKRPTKKPPVRPPHLKPETLMMSHGYHPAWSEGAIKCPIFQTSTFVFQSAEEGKAFFEIAYGVRKQKPSEKLGLIYSRLNNPDLEILENRLCLWDEGDDAAVFESGMAAIATTMLEFLSPGDLLVHSEPVYGGTDHLFTHVLTRLGIHVVSFRPTDTADTIRTLIRKSGHADRLAMIFVESPANPTNDLLDMNMCAALAREFSTPEHRVITAMDNTFLGPIWCHPLQHGIDLVLYSATKYIGGHSDLIAGVCIGSKELLARVKTLRSFLGTMAGPWTCWLLLRSLETLQVRMRRQTANAETVAQWLARQRKIRRVYYLGLLPKDHPQYAIYKKKCLGPGAMISFDIKGGEKEAFRFLNRLKLIKLAVSLGGTESLAEHPTTMTHAGVDCGLKKALGVSDSMIRISVGVEAPEDIIWDIEQALEGV